MVVLQHAHQFAFVGVKFKLAWLADGTVYINKVAEIVAETRIVGAWATNHLAHLALQVDGVDLAVDGRVFRGLEIDLLAVETVNFRHIPLSFSKLLHQSTIQIVKVNVVVAALFGSHQETLAVLKEMPIVGDVDVIFVGLVVKHTALARSGIGGQNLKMVLMAIQALNG